MSADFTGSPLVKSLCPARFLADHEKGANRLARARCTRPHRSEPPPPPSRSASSVTGRIPPSHPPHCAHPNNPSSRRSPDPVAFVAGARDRVGARSTRAHARGRRFRTSRRLAARQSFAARPTTRLAPLGPVGLSCGSRSTICGERDALSPGGCRIDRSELAAGPEEAGRHVFLPTMWAPARGAARA